MGKSAAHTSELVKEFYNDVYQPFFTGGEIARILEGSDMYLTSSQVNERIEAVVSQQEEEEDEIISE